MLKSGFRILDRQDKNYHLSHYCRIIVFLNSPRAVVHVAKGQVMVNKKIPSVCCSHPG